MSLNRLPLHLMDQFGALGTSLVIPSKPQRTAAPICARRDFDLVEYSLGFAHGSATKFFLAVVVLNAVFHLSWKFLARSPLARAHRLCFRRSRAVPTLSYCERIFVLGAIDPDDNCFCFANTQGLEVMKRLLTVQVTRPLQYPEANFSPLIKGIILTGGLPLRQRQMAKAIAKEADAVFLPLHLSGHDAKWGAKTNKMFAAAFSLAQKLQPAIDLY